MQGVHDERQASREAHPSHRPKRDNEGCRIGTPHTWVVLYSSNRRASCTKELCLHLYQGAVRQSRSRSRAHSPGGRVAPRSLRARPAQRHSHGERQHCHKPSVVSNCMPAERTAHVQPLAASHLQGNASATSPRGPPSRLSRDTATARAAAQRLGNEAQLRPGHTPCEIMCTARYWGWSGQRGHPQ